MTSTGAEALAQVEPRSESLHIGNRAFSIVRPLKTGAVNEALLAEDSHGNPCVVKVAISGPESEVNDKRVKNESQVLKMLTGVPEATSMLAAGQCRERNGRQAVVVEYVVHDDDANPHAYSSITKAQQRGEGESYLRGMMPFVLGFLRQAHERGVEYYDFKRDHPLYNPGNQPPLKIIDFNLSKMHREDRNGQWRVNDLQALSALSVQFLLGTRNFPTFDFSLLPDTEDGELISRIDILDKRMRNISPDMRLFLGWLGGGYYSSAEEAMADFERLQGIGTEEQGVFGLARIVEERRVQAETLVLQGMDKWQKGDAKESKIDLSQAWRMMPARNPNTNSTSLRVYLALALVTNRNVVADSDLKKGILEYLYGLDQTARETLGRATSSEARQILGLINTRFSGVDLSTKESNDIAIEAVSEGHAPARAIEIPDIIKESLAQHNYKQAYELIREVSGEETIEWAAYLGNLIRTLDNYWNYSRPDRTALFDFYRLPVQISEFACFRTDAFMINMAVNMAQSAIHIESAMQAVAENRMKEAIKHAAQAAKIGRKAVIAHAQARGVKQEIIDAEIDGWVRYFDQLVPALEAKEKGDAQAINAIVLQYNTDIRPDFEQRLPNIKAFLEEFSGSEETDKVI